MNKPRRYMFPAVLETSEEGGVFVYFPDVPGCTSAGDDDLHAAQQAKEALAISLEYLESIEKPIPMPSPIKSIQTESPEDRIIYVDTWMLPYRDEVANKVVTKNCTLPKWLRDAGEEEGLNFSQLLQTAVKEALGILK